MPSVSTLVAVLVFASVPRAKDFFVSALRGKNTNTGTIQSPFKTITHALTAVQPNDRIFVLPGRYGPRNGETFPLTVPKTVSLIGTEPRSCVIDAEFDPNVPNPKDPKVNPVQGDLLHVGGSSRIANLSIVNGPRNPKNPGDYWWAIAILVQDPNGNARDLEIDHLRLDEFSRGIVCGGPVGAHGMSNIRIHDVIFTRSHVEAINSWIRAGTASGNIAYNCTVSGHVNPSSGKPFMRAALSFGDGAQFDIRNSALLHADWARIENAGQNTKITSDYNCIFAGSNPNFSAYRGVAKGANDLLTDPLLMRLPSLRSVMDPHQGIKGSPLFQKGTNLPGQPAHNDMDLGSKRIFAAIVDIGADEWSGLDCYVSGIARAGRPVRLDMIGARSMPGLFLLGFGALASGVKIPGFNGELWIDPSKPLRLFLVPKDSRGHGTLSLPIPSGALGVELFLQGIDLPAGLLPALTDLDKVTILN
ncbi:MAG: DUF1565 domain-containing protein [Planctomycetota bacterium]